MALCLWLWASRVRKWCSKRSLYQRIQPKWPINSATPCQHFLLLNTKFQNPVYQPFTKLPRRRLARRAIQTLPWIYHIKFQIRPKGGKFCAKFELRIGGKGEGKRWFESSGSKFIDSGFYLEYRDLD